MMGAEGVAAAEEPPPPPQPVQRGIKESIKRDMRKRIENSIPKGEQV